MDYIAEKEIDGIVYRAKFKGMAFALSVEDAFENNKSQLKISELLFREILISPKVTIDDFADFETLFQVREFLSDVATGNFFIKDLNRGQLKSKVKEDWGMWRLVMSEKFDFQTVFGKPFMTPQDILEANTALDLQLEAEKRAMKKK